MMKQLTALATILVGSFTAPGAALAQTAAPSGHWEGAIQVPAQELKIEVDLKRTGEKWEGTISIPAQRLVAFPLSSITSSGDKVSFAMAGVPGNPMFNGTVSKDGKSIEGQFAQGGGTLAFSVTRTGEPKIEAPPTSTPLTKDLVGSWQGALDVNGTVLRLIFKLANGPNGIGGGTVVSVDQNGVEIPITAIVQQGSHVKIIVQSIAAAYEGDLKDGELTGTWSQGPLNMALPLKRS